MEKKIQKIFILIAEIMIIAAFIIAGLIILVRKNEKMDREMELRRAVKCVGNNLYIKKDKSFINQNKKCQIIDDCVYIYENDNLKKYE